MMLNLVISSQFLKENKQSIEKKWRMNFVILFIDVQVGAPLLH